MSIRSNFVWLIVVGCICLGFNIWLGFMIARSKQPMPKPPRPSAVCTKTETGLIPALNERGKPVLLPYTKCLEWRISS